MNEWQYYRAECSECTLYDVEAGKCGRNPGRKEKGVCLSFTLTHDAEARRYVSAYRYAQKIGMKYDASRAIYNGKIHQVRRRIDRLLKGVNTK